MERLPLSSIVRLYCVEEMASQKLHSQSENKLENTRATVQKVSLLSRAVAVRLLFRMGLVTGRGSRTEGRSNWGSILSEN
jgi:hypothetical protein